MLCGEILAAVGTLLRLAEEAARDGSFLNSLQYRFLTTARSEIDVYERNRELLFSIEDADLRARIHSFVIRLSIPLDRLAEDRARYLELRAAGQETSQQVQALRQEMDGAFSYLIGSRILIPDLLASLRPLARTRFDSYSRIDSDGIPREVQVSERMGDSGAGMSDRKVPR